MMRELCVTEWKDIKLGPAPIAHVAKEAAEEDPHAKARRRHEVMFAASSVRPPFVPPAENETGTLRHLVQRRERTEGRRGSQGTSR